jgi:hypothetical protein
MCSIAFWVSELEQMVIDEVRNGLGIHRLFQNFFRFFRSTRFRFKRFLTLGSSDIALQFGNAIADFAAVEFGVRFAGTASAGAAALAGSGVSRGTLVAGDSVVIKGNPGRNAADNRMRLISITRPSDGWVWGQAYN